MSKLIKTIVENAFNGLNSFQEFHLDNNQVQESLKNGIFQNFSNHQELNLSDNNLTTMPDIAFNGQTNLNYLCFICNSCSNYEKQRIRTVVPNTTRMQF